MELSGSSAFGDRSWRGFHIVYSRDGEQAVFLTNFLVPYRPKLAVSAGEVFSALGRPVGEAHVVKYEHVVYVPEHG